MSRKNLRKSANGTAEAKGTLAAPEALVERDNRATNTIELRLAHIKRSLAYLCKRH